MNKIILFGSFALLVGCANMSSKSAEERTPTSTVNADSTYICWPDDLATGRGLHGSQTRVTVNAAMDSAAVNHSEHPRALAKMDSIQGTIQFGSSGTKNMGGEIFSVPNYLSTTPVAPNTIGDTGVLISQSAAHSASHAGAGEVVAGLTVQICRRQ